MKKDKSIFRFVWAIGLILAANGSNLLFGQISIPNTTPITQNFDAMGSSSTASLPANWKMSPAGAAAPTWAAAGNFTAVNQQASSGTPTAGGRYNWGTSATERALGVMTSGSYASPSSIMAFFTNTNASAITDLTISYDLERYRVNTAVASVQFYYSLDGSTWTAATAGDIAAASIPTGANAYNFSPGLTVNVSAFTISGLSIANASSVYLRWNLNTTGSNSQGIGIDNFSLTATFGTPTPVISTSTSSLSSLSYLYGLGPSAEQTFTVSGANLTANISLTAPTDYEISLTTGSGFTNSLSLAPASGTVAATTIYVRLKAGLSVGSYNAELINCTSTGATTKTVSLNGDVTTAGVFINELMVNPSGPNDGSNMPNTSEWVELYNSDTVAVDVSCWFITDGDFAVTFPSVTIIPAGGYLTIASAAGSGLSPDIDWALCGCTSGPASEIGIFTNSGEQLLLYNAAGTLVDAVIWGGGQLPGSMTTSAVGSCSSVSVTLPSAASGSYEDIGTTSDGVSNERDTDGSSTWTQASPNTFGTSNGSVPLPIELLTFTVAAEGSAVLLNWETASEINNDYFTVQRSNDGINYADIAIVDGAGNSKTTNSYSYVDHSPKQGINSYRLRQTDFDGHRHYSNVQLVEITSELPLLLYPNPAAGQVTISNITNENEILSISIYSVMGELVRNYSDKPNNGTMQLSVNELPAGSYFLQIDRTTGKQIVLFLKK